MTGARPALSRRLRLMGAAVSLGAATMLAAVPACARGPDGIADIAEKVIDAVVNISTSQTVEAKGGGGGDRGATPQLPPGSPFEEFFDDFFKNRRGPGGGSKGGEKGGEFQPRKTNSLGSGFIVDTAGIVVTNNHVIADADEINVIMNDGTKIRAELVGVDKKTDLAVLKFKPVKPLVAVKFGDSIRAAGKRRRGRKHAGGANRHRGPEEAQATAKGWSGTGHISFSPRQIPSQIGDGILRHTAPERGCRASM